MRKIHSWFLLAVAALCAGVASAGEIAVTTIAGNNQSALMHEGFSTPLMVSVKGKDSNPVANAKVHFLVPANGPGCDFGGGANLIVVTTDADGIARANCVAANGWGKFSVTANVEGSADAARFDLGIRQGESGPGDSLGSPVLSFGMATTPTVLTLSSVSSPLNGTTSLSARLTRSGSAITNVSVAFTINSSAVGSATTNGSGTATLPGVSLVGISVGTYPTGVGVSYAGDFVNLPSSQTASLTITAPTVPGAPTIGTATAGNGSASVTFTAPASDGGSAITSYTVSSVPSGFTGTGASSPITVSGLTNGTAYNFFVTATNGVGTGSPSLGSNSVTPAGAPGAPTIGTATAGNANASVTFTAPGSNGGSAITGYTVTASPGGATGTGLTSPITVNGLTNGTAYTFTVTATNIIGTGSASAGSNSVTPIGLPGAPTIGGATPGNASASVSFTAPLSNGGSAITGYTVTASPGGLTGGGTTSPITVSGLTNGTAYTFTVTATTGIGTSAASSASNNVTPAAAPGAPTIGTATAGNGNASVTFSAPGSNGGATITSYTVTASPGGFAASGASSPITVGGLTNGTAYIFTVTATNVIGTGSASGGSNSVTPATVPGAPSIGTATPGNAGASVTFTAPGNNGGSTITGYTVTVSPGGLTGGGSASPILVSGLTNGTAYNFTVTATNGVGTGAASSASNSVTPVSVPGAPTIGGATAGNASASVSFTAPGSNGGSAITGYTVTSSPGGLTGAGSISPIMVSGLTNGTAYTFTVTATNTVGTGPASGGSNSVTPATAPGAPAIGSATPGNASASVTFTAPGTNGGAPITSYTVTASPGGITGSGSSSPITVSGLTNGTAYTFSVTATNSVGTGAASASSPSVTPVTLPGSPTILSVTPGNTSASVGFAPPASNGGSAITSYSVTATPGGFTGTGLASPITVSGLSNGSFYVFTVTATNAVGTGPASGPLPSLIPATAPGAPTIGAATPGNANASVTFTAPGSTGGAPITGYTVTSSPGGLTGTGATSPITVSGLSNGTAYTFTVTATNSAGTGAASGASGSIIPATVPGAPAIGSAARGSHSAVISFTAPASNGGSAITSYMVTSSPGGFTGSGLSSPITVVGLNNGTAYTFTVTATNSVGTGAASGASNSVTPATVPVAPTIRPASAGNASAQVAFLPPEVNGGSPITGYTATSNPGGVTGTGSASPILVTGLTNGTSYTFTVTAANSVGTGPVSSSSNSVTPATVPDAPVIGIATAGNTTVSVAFTAPGNNGGSVITGYTVCSSPARFNGAAPLGLLRRGASGILSVCSGSGGLAGTGLTSPILVTGLTNGVTYTFIVIATNSVGAGAASAGSNSATPATVPDAPAIGTATPGNSSVSVTFTAPGSSGGSAITGYTVTSSPGGLTGTGSTSPIAVTGLTNGTVYSFTITATNSVGTSSSSAASNTVTPVTVPGAPTIGTATTGNTSVSVTFTAPASSGGTSITGYIVTASPGGLTGTGLASPITVTGLTNGVAYTFTVTATNSVGTGPASAASNGVTPATAPSAPAIGTATLGNGSASVTFTAPASNGGAAITNYTVTSIPGGFTGTGSSSPITVNGLTNGAAYTFTMTATNSAGTSAASAASNSVTIATVPGAPAVGIATPGNGSASVSFTAPVSNGGAAITSYTVTSIPGGFTGTGSSSPILVSGLTNGTAYTFTVTATNSVGTGAVSAASNSVTAATVPGVPAIGNVTSGNGGGNLSVTVFFTAPASNGGAAITGYTVTTHPGGATTGGLSSPIVVTNLSSATVYTFTVTATNSAGTGAASASSTSVTLVVSPDAPTGVSAAAGNASATVSFTAPTNNGGAPIQVYTITSNPGNLTGTGTSSPITVAGLTNGTLYTFTVTATNIAGSGNSSASSNSVTPSSQTTAPGAPGMGAATAGNGSAIVSFAAPASNGGAPITNYIVTSIPGGITGTGTSSPITVVGLTNGVAYTFTVSATNSAGTGAASGASNSVTPNSGVPGAPQQVHATSGNGQATVSFTAPASSGGSAVASYTVTANPGGFSATGTSSPIIVSGLKNGASYTFTVTATNGAGSGAASDPSNLVMLATLLGLDSQSSFPRGLVGTDYPLQILTASGGTPPYTFVITNGQVPGLTFSVPQLSGIPTQSGDFSFTIIVTDSAGNTASAVKSISIAPAQADLILSQSTTAFSLTAGSGSTPTPASITIRSSVVQQLLKYSVAVSPVVAWLDVTAGATTPGSLTIALNQAALALPIGASTTTINVTCLAPSPCAGNTQAILVSLLVNAPPPQISLTTGLISFTAGGSSTSAQSQTVGLQNVGGGTITGISATSADSWLSASNLPSTLASGPAVPITVAVNPAGLAPGYYRSTVTINSSAGPATLAVTLLMATSVTVTLGPSGTQYYVPAGGALGNSSGTFAVIVTGGASAAYSASVVPGPAWLSVVNGAGTAALAAPGSVSYSLDPATVGSLAAGIYYGAIRVVSADAVDSPQDFLIALNVTAASQPVAPELSTGGLIFVSDTNGAAAPQTVKVFASSVSPLNYQASAATGDGKTWLSVSPSTGTASAGSPGTSTISINTGGLAPGVYRGGVSYAFSAASVRTVNVTLIIPTAANASVSGLHAEAASTCAAAMLVGTQTGLVTNFARPLGLPVPLMVYLVNDCGTPVSNAQVTATFSNGDPLLPFFPVSTIAGLYTATWTPRNVSAQVTVTSLASIAGASIAGLSNGSNQVTGEVTASKVPVLGLGLMLNAFNPLVGGALAPGTVVQIYGSNLASSTAQAQSAPLPLTLAGTSVTIGGIAAPLFYASPSQINAQIPWELRTGYEYEISVKADGGEATPNSVQIALVSPGVAALASGDAIATHADGSLIGAASPAKPGEVVILYLTGLGANDIPIATGAASPANPLAHPHSSPTVTLNGASAVVNFAGLSPGSVGLYQINFQVPAGTPDGDLPLTVSQGSVSANTVSLAVHQ